MRKTKIVCTIGPACDSEETLRAMMLAGMNVARLNFSHGTHAEHQVRIDRIKKLRAELDLPIAIMLDTKGPEYRIGTFENGKIELHSGDTFTFTTEAVTGNAERVSVSYAGLAQDLEPGDTVLVNDGLIALTVTATTDTDVVCRVTAGGVLSDRKSMSFPNKVLKQTFLSEQDKRDLLFGIENDVDFVAASFVSRRQDLVDLNGFLRAHGGGDISVIAKIENQPGIDNIEDIFTECTGIMIARGDMGVEVPYEELPSIQKELIGKCRLLGKRVITATEMLESMTHNMYLVVPDLTEMLELRAQQNAYANEHGGTRSMLNYTYQFDLSGTDDEQLDALHVLLSDPAFESAAVAANVNYTTDMRADGYPTLRSTYGGFLFLGFFLGFVFLFATVLIIYYKQVSEGYDDRGRFRIMQQVGMTPKEVKATIRTQVLLMFFLPLVTAAIHIAFAFPLIKQIVFAFGLQNVHLFLLCTLGTFGVFALLYTFVYLLTARTYYRIVRMTD